MTERGQPSGEAGAARAEGRGSGLAEALDGLGDPDRAAAAAAATALLAGLRRLAATRLRGVPEAEREDTVAAVALKVWETARSSRLDARSPETLLGLMLVRHWTDAFWRKAERRKTTSLDAMADAQGVDRLAALEDRGGALETLEAEERALRGRFERLLAAALETRAPRYREDLERDVLEIARLAVGSLTMERAIAEEAARGRAASRVAVRNRLFKRHERARSALLEAVAALEAGGRVGADEAARMRRDCALLLRCQRAAAERVPDGEDEGR